MTVFVMLLLLVGGLGFLAYAMLGSSDSGTEKPATGPGSSPATPGPAPAPSSSPSAPAGAAVEINVAYGTEKKLWLEAAAKEFEDSPEGRGVRVRLVGLGSVEGAQAVLRGPGATPIHAWSPASSAYRDVFETEWGLAHGGGKPILRADNLALTPMIYVLWKERYDAMAARFRPLSFRTIGDAMQETSGWAGIANKPDWGLFKFGHTHPNQSNSGLVTLVLMAYEHAGKDAGLSLADITKPEFQEWMQKFERGVARPGGELSNSTGTLMREMV